MKCVQNDGGCGDGCGGGGGCDGEDLMSSEASSKLGRPLGGEFPTKERKHLPPSTPLLGIGQDCENKINNLFVTNKKNCVVKVRQSHYSIPPKSLPNNN